jgi:hypothetical protein
MRRNSIKRKRQDLLETWILQSLGGGSAKEAMANRAESLVCQAGVTRAPVRLAKIAELMGLNPRPIYKPNTMDGSIKIIDGVLRIILKHEKSTPQFANSHNFRRLRFTYAHEMSHALFYDLHAVPQKRLAPHGNYRLEEQLCNLAASRFLLPTPILQTELSNIKDLSPQLLCTLSDHFQVSIQTIAYRLTEFVCDKLQIDRFYMISLHGTGVRGLGVHKPRCIACFIPKPLTEKGMIFLHPFQGIDRIKNGTGTDSNPWSLEEFFSRAMHKQSGGTFQADETLRCPNGHYLRLKALHQTIGHGPLVWTTGTISDFQ